MNNSFIKIVLLISLCIIGINTNAQGQTPEFNVIAEGDASVVKLKWIINDYDLLKIAQTKGFKIDRLTTRSDTHYFDLDTQLVNKVTIVNDVELITEAQWDSQFSSDNELMTLKELFYETNFDTTYSNGNFAAAVHNRRLKDNLLFFNQVISDKSIEVAEALGLAYQDNSALPDEDYLYIISMNDTTANISVGIEASLNSIQNLKAPEIGSTKASDKEITLYWDLSTLDNTYAYYDIERSEDSISFQKVNADPYVFMTNQLDREKIAHYQDSVDYNGLKYYYRIVGKTPFGTCGPYSEMVSETARDEPLDIDLYISQVKDSLGSAFVKWGTLDQIYTDSLTGFDVLVSENVNGPYQIKNSGLLSSSLREYQDNNAESNVFYKLKSYDYAGNEYESLPKYYYINDTIPPTVPINFMASVDEHTITLDWTANDEPDLLGYRVYRCFIPNGEFALISDGTIFTNQLVDNLQGLVNTDTLYYRIEALDQTTNRSGYSAPLPVKRDDMLAPSNPLLYKAMPHPSGVALAWKYSASPDVTIHELQRKPDDAPGWETLLTIPVFQQDNYVFDIPNSITSTCWVDTSNLERRAYDYQFIAYDAAGNVSASDIITVRPFDSGERGSVDNFDLQATCDVNNVCTLDLNWSYELDGHVSGFEIYRSRNNNSITLYKTLNIDFFYGGNTPPTGTQSFVYTDTDVTKDIPYIYYIITRHTDGGYSEQSSVLNITP